MTSFFTDGVSSRGTRQWRAFLRDNRARRSYGLFGNGLQAKVIVSAEFKRECLRSPFLIGVHSDAACSWWQSAGAGGPSRGLLVVVLLSQRCALVCCGDLVGALYRFHSCTSHPSMLADAPWNLLNTGQQNTHRRVSYEPFPTVLPIITL